MLKPGDKVGDMTVNTMTGDEADTAWLGQYCDLSVSGEFPVSVERDCRIPPLTSVHFGLGTPEGVWEERKWEVHIDGQPVDLEAFGTMVMDFGSGPTRMWRLGLQNLTPGAHTLYRRITRNDGSPHVEFMLNLTVASEATTVSTLPTEPVAGQHPYTSEAAGLDFLLYIPEEYGADPQRNWPLILFLHGGPEGLPHRDLVARTILPAFLQTEADFPFIVASPYRDQQCYECWDQDQVVQPLFRLLEEIQSLYAVDASRVYLSGDSAGANGVWMIALDHPERFAALVPVAGYWGYPFAVADNICDLKDVPVWAFHGANDETIPLDAEQGLVEALQACGGTAQITVLPDTGHDVDPQQVYTEELTAWLLSHELPMLKPGDKIGGMVLNTFEGSQVKGRWLSDYCDMVFDGPLPIKLVRECTLPPLSSVFLHQGQPAQFWPGRRWEISIDGRQIDLEAFGTIDVDFGGGVDTYWRLVVDNLTPGTHSVHRKIFMDEAEPRIDFLNILKVTSQ
jgi:predicted esterase